MPIKEIQDYLYLVNHGKMFSNSIKCINVLCNVFEAEHITVTCPFDIRDNIRMMYLRIYF